MAVTWLVDRIEGIPSLVMRYDPANHVSQITSNGITWVDSDIPNREVMRGGCADQVSEAEARSVFGRLPDDAVQ